MWSFFRNSSIKKFAKSQQKGCKTTNSLPTPTCEKGLTVSVEIWGVEVKLNIWVWRLWIAVAVKWITWILTRYFWNRYCLPWRCISLVYFYPMYSLTQLHPFRNGSNVCHVDPSAILLTAATKINMHLMPGRTGKKEEFFDSFAAVAW